MERICWRGSSTWTITAAEVRTYRRSVDEQVVARARDRRVVAMGHPNWNGQPVYEFPGLSCRHVEGMPADF